MTLTRNTILLSSLRVNTLRSDR